MLTVVLTTYNRKELFKRTVASLHSANATFRLVVVENHSTDGTKELAQDMTSKGVITELLLPETKLPMLYQTQLMGIDYILKDSLPDLILMTADDFEYKPEWLEAVSSWFKEAPPNVAYCTLYKEPEWWWNATYSTLKSDGHISYVRRTVPGACWVFNLDGWKFIEPNFRAWSHDGQLDVNMCEWVYKNNRICCALDLAEHIGKHASLYGNISYGAKPVNV